MSKTQDFIENVAKNTTNNVKKVASAVENLTGNAGGIASANKVNKTAAVSQPTSGITAPTQNGNAMAKAPDGMMGIRDTLVNRGISNDRIGWNDGSKSITVDGKEVYKPQSIVNGTSYATENDINNITDTVYNNAGNPIMQVTGYVASQGIPNGVNWNDGKLTVGGINVPVAYVKDGKAYANRKDIDNAVAMYKASAGIKGNQGVYDSYNEKYGSQIDDALDKVLNREEWSYNPDEDKAYQAYKDMYMREGNRAYQDAVAKMAGGTGGYGSSVAATAGGQQLNYYNQQLNDKIPELMAQDYGRYMDEQELNRLALNNLMSVANNDYNKEYIANRDSVGDSASANYYNYLRDTGARDYNTDVYRYERERPYQEAILNQQIESGDISNQMAKLQYVLSKNQYSGNIDEPISAEDARLLGATMKADGTYPTIREIQENYSRLQALSQLINWNEYGKKETIDTYNISKGLGA